MFDDLLDQMQSVLSETKKLKGPGKSTTSASAPLDGPFIDCTKTYGKVASFTRAGRFKAMEKEELKTSDIDWPAQNDSVVSEPRKFSFSKKQRFQADKPKYTQTYINPDFNLIKKNTKNNVPIYYSPSKQLNESKVSISTVDSDSFRAPGFYDPKEQQRVRNGLFSKDNRFKQDKMKYQDTPLLINENQTKKRPPMSTVMRPRIAKTKQLISRQRQEQLREKLKFVYWRNIPLEFDRLFKNNSGPVIREQHFNLSKLKGKQKRSALLMMLERMNYLRGGFEQDIATKIEGPCGVVYRRSTPKPFKFSQMQPGPDYYYPTDDYLRADAVGFTFKREGLKQKQIQYDNRCYQIEEEIMKKGGNIVINPVHQEHRLTSDQLSSLQRGPGFYDCLFKLVEQRTDVGVVPYQAITDKNDRQNNCVQISQANDGVYFPSFQGIDPKLPAPVYKAPSNVKPAHLPDKVLFPEHWMFYDGDLNRVKAEIAKNVLLAKNMTFKQYQAYQLKFKRFKQYLEIQKKGPEAGEYQVDFKAVDPHVFNADFGKMEEKTLIDPITKPEGDYDGDNLIIDPQPLKPHLPNVDFKKMEGRTAQENDPNGDPKEGDRLVLNPKKIEKHVPNVIFQTQEGRPEGISQNSEEPPEGDVLVINPIPVQPHVPNIDFAKQAERPEVRTEQDEGAEVNIINLRPQENKAKGVPFSRLSSVRLVPLLRQRSRLKPEVQEENVE